MALSCIPKSVLSTANCLENPAGTGNHLFVVPLDTNHISSMVANDEKNQYDITPVGGKEAALKGYRIDFKSQTGNYKSDDNGTGKGWSSTATGRVELSEDDMAHTSRILHNSDQNLYFLYTGKVVDGKNKKFIKGGRLKYYPSGMPLFSASRGMKRPVVEHLTNKEAEERTKDCELVYRETYIIGSESNGNLIDKQYYKAIKD